MDPAAPRRCRSARRRGRSRRWRCRSRNRPYRCATHRHSKAAAPEWQSARSSRAQPRIEQCIEDVGQQSEADIEHGEHQHHRLHDRKIILGDALPAEIADAMHREHGLDDDRAAQHEAELDRGDRHDGNGGVAQRMLEDDARPRQAFCARGADIIRGHRLDHSRARQPRQRRDRRKGEHDTRHHEMLPGAGARDRQDAELQAEHDHQDQRQPEAWHRLPYHREQGDAAVHPGIFAQRRQDAEWNRDDQREAQAHEAERDRDRQALLDQVRHAVLEEIALAEITDHGAAGPGEELDIERAIEAVGLAHDFDVGLRRLRARDRNREVARQPRQQECERHHGERDQHTDGKTPGNQTQHLQNPQDRRARPPVLRPAKRAQRCHQTVVPCKSELTMATIADRDNPHCDDCNVRATTTSGLTIDVRSRQGLAAEKSSSEFNVPGSRIRAMQGRTGHRGPPPRSLRPFFERPEPAWRHTAAGCAASGFIGESEPVSCLRRSRCCPAACPRLSARVIRLIPRRLNFVSVRSAGLTQSRPTVAPHIAAEAPLGGMMKSVLKWVIWLYVAAACAYVFYEWYAYSGLYRLAAEWQLEHYGSYGLKLTLIVPLIVVLMPAAVLVSLTGMQDQLRGAGSGVGSSATFALLGVVALAVAAGAGWYGYARSMETFDGESLDLSKGDTPRSTHVTITGI